MTDIDMSKIPDEVMATAMDLAIDGIKISGLGEDVAIDYQSAAIVIAIAILTERAACAQHAFAMRWAPPLELQGTKDAEAISKITTDWSQKIGMEILNR